MKTADLQRTKHYTTNYKKIFNGLLDVIPSNAQLIEPFVGGGDLLNLFLNYQWEKYDIDEAIECVHQDTLKNPPSYINKWVITNPPFLGAEITKSTLSDLIISFVTFSKIVFVVLITSTQ